MKNNKLKVLSYDLVFLGIGMVIMSVFGLVMLSNSAIENLDHATAQSIPNNPGGGLIELPTTDESEPAPEPSSDQGTIDGPAEVPMPEDPVIINEEIDESGDTVELDPAFNLNNNIDTSNPIEPSKESVSQPAPVENTPAPENNTTVRSGGEAVLLTLLGVAGAIIAVVYYRKRGNRKSNFKMTEKKGKK